MADVTVLETLSLLTKVSADTSDLIKQLSSRIDNIQGIDTSGKEKEELVKKAEPVIVTDFGKAAEKDLAKIGGDAEKERQKTETEKNKNNNLLKLLGLAGASALALKFLFDGEGYTGLVQGFQKAFQNTTNFANKSKGLIDDIGKRLGTFADDIGSRIGVIVDKIMTKTNTWAKSAKVGIKNAMDDIGKRLGTFGDDIARGLTAVVNNAKNIASRVAQTSTGLGDDIARGGVRAAATQPGIFSRVVSGAKSIGGATLEGAKNLGSKTIQGAKYVGGKVIDTGKVVGGAVVEQGRRAVNFTKEQVLKPVGNLISKVKPLKILKSIAKSPFLAPAFEAFFTGKDIKNLKDRYATGEIDLETLNFLVGKRLIKSVTGLIGGLSGATLAAPLGSFIPIAGNIATAIIGGVLGDVGGRLIGGMIANAMGPKTSSLGEFALNTKFLGGDKGFSESPIEIDDGVILKSGKVIKTDSEDTIYAMKDSGPLEEALNKTPIMLKHLINVEHDSLNLLKQQNLLLKAILDKTGIIAPPVINQPNNITNFDQSGDNFRSLQMNY